MVFVPYRGFYFLNNQQTQHSQTCERTVFVPYRGFYFLNSIDEFLKKEYRAEVFVPYRGFYFLNPGLTILVFMRVKKMFCGVNLF